jgi:hypothetical protein
MKKLLFLLLLLPFLGNSQATFTAPVGYNTGAPTATPSGVGTRWRFDLLTGKKYTWLPGSTSWDEDARGIDQVAGCSAPLYTPGYNQSTFAVNACAIPELYQWTGADWVQLNEGEVYTAGTGISIDGSNVITNTAPNIVQTLSIAGQDLTLSGGGGTVEIPAGASDALGTGFTAGGGTGSIPNGTTAVTGNFIIDNGDELSISVQSDNIGILSPKADLKIVSGDGLEFLAKDGGFAAFSADEFSDIFFVAKSGSNGLKVQDLRATPIGLVYTADYSATISANPRSIPDVGTVEQIIAAENGALGTGFTSGGGSGTIPGETIAQVDLSTAGSWGDYISQYLYNQPDFIQVDEDGFRGVGLQANDPNTGYGYFIGSTEEQPEALIIKVRGSGGTAFYGFNFNSVSIQPSELMTLSAGTSIGISTPLIDISGVTGLGRFTITQRNAIPTPATGYTIFCTDATATDGSTGVMQVYNGSTWKNAW